jgi:hypothetical protein
MFHENDSGLYTFRPHKIKERERERTASSKSIPLYRKIGKKLERIY